MPEDRAGDKAEDRVSRSLLRPLVSEQARVDVGGGDHTMGSCISSSSSSK